MSAADERILMVANPGGHLQQLVLLDERLPFEQPRLWVTADTPQSRSLLRDRDVVFVPDVGSRQYSALIANLPRGNRILGEYRFVAAVSTGSGLALAFLPSAAARRIPAHYIESATRTDGPSLTGRLLQSVPGVHTYTQHVQWASERWPHAGSVFDGFRVVEIEDAEATFNRAVVSLGTSRIYPFRRLVDRLVAILPPELDVVWQTGCTDVAGLGIDTRDQVPADEMADAIKNTDLVIAHAGTGIALTAFAAGRSPVLVPRIYAHGEHVDDHQSLTADILAATGLAVTRRVEHLDPQAIEQATRRRVEKDLDGAGSLRLR